MSILTTPVGGNVMEDFRTLVAMIRAADEPEEWTYDPKARRYRNVRTGRFMSHNGIVASRDRYITARASVTDDLVADWISRADGVSVGSPAWESMVSELDRTGWRETESTFITEYVHGKGGINNLTDADYTRLQSMLSEQHQYWEGFMADVESGKLSSEAGIRNRMNMYTNNSRSFHARGMAAAWDLELPTYPGEQVCGSGCKCSWRLRETKKGIEAYWELGMSATSCPECIQNADEYNPYLIEREEESEA